MNLFVSQNIENQIAYFSAEESHHAVKVLRLSLGSMVKFIDGNGGRYEGELIFVSKSQMQVKILSSFFDSKTRNYHLHVAIAPTKNMERIEWFLEKAVELGIDEITFLICERSERRVLKMDRLQKIMESAVKQSLQSFMPKMNSLISFTTFLKSANLLGTNRFIAHCYPTDFEKISLNSLKSDNGNYIFLIGPEGDFSIEEIEKAKQHQFVDLDLGENRLRTETAGLLICAGMALNK